MKQLALIHRQTLPGAFKLLGLVPERRNTIPVLGHIRLTGVAPDRVVAAVTDLDIYLPVDIPAETIDFDITLPARSFLSMMSGSSGTVTISSDQAPTGGGLMFRLSDSTAAMLIRDTIPAIDMPKVSAAGPLATTTVSEEEVHRLFRLGRHCVSTEETRYYLNGTFLTPHPEGNGMLRAVSTDGHRLAVIDSDTVYPSDGPKVIVPVKVVDIIMAATRKGGNASVEISLHDECRISVKFGDAAICAKTIDGSYPDYTRITAGLGEGEISASLTHDAIKRLADLALGAGCDRRSAIKFTGAETPSEGRMSIRSPEGNEVEMAAHCAGGKFGVNCGYLLQQSKVTRTMKMDSPCGGDPIRILSDDPRALWVVMPMRV